MRRQKPGAPPARDKLQLVIKDRERPNGIAFSPDEKFVYIAECHESVLRRAEVGEHRRVAEFWSQFVDSWSCYGHKILPQMCSSKEEKYL